MLSLCRSILALSAVLVMGAACGTSPTTSAPYTRPTSSAASATATTSVPARRGPAQIAAAMTPEELAGAVLMPGSRTPLPTSQMTGWVRDRHVGSLLIDYPSSSSPASERTRLASTIAVGKGSLLIAIDQEGGLIQRFSRGFSPIPSALAQGQLSPATLQQRAYAWGRELAEAGINLDLAPVLDVVPPGTGRNPPIGDLKRQYGSTPNGVTASALAFANGLWQAHVASSGKHFPGLGRVTANPDYADGIVDTVTTRHDPLLAPYAAMVQNRAGFMMVSTAVYQQIDPGVPAAFSRTIVTDMLRGDLGFKSVIISDDLGKAAQVATMAPGERAIRFIQAGGDLIIAVNPDHGNSVDPMLDALIAKAKTDPAFRALLVASVTRILTEKQAMGLLPIV